MTESKKRTIIKAVSYRGLVSMILALLSWIFTTNVEQTAFITIVYAVLATAGYYGHERIWNKIDWERKKNNHVARSNSNYIWLIGKTIPMGIQRYCRSVFVAILISISTLSYLTPSDSQLEGQSSELTTWGPRIEYRGNFLSPFGITSDSSGNVYISDWKGNNVQKFAANGTFLSLVGDSGSAEGQFSSPFGLATNPTTNSLYILEQGGSRVQELSADGQFLAMWGKASASAGSSPNDGTFSSPIGIATDSDGNVYVADTGNNRIQKFKANGIFIAKWGSHGTQDGQFGNPNAITADSSGHIYVSDVDNRRIQKFTTDGEFVGKWNISSSSLPSDGPVQSETVVFGIATDRQDNVYVTTSKSEVLKFSPQGHLLDRWVAQGVGITINSVNDHVYVVDYFNSKITVFTMDGQFIKQWGNRASTEDQFSNPNGIVTDLKNNVYVLDSGNFRVQKFMSDGKLIKRWSISAITSEQGYSLTNSITIDRKADLIYVSDDQYRVRKFDTDGNQIAQWNISSTESGDRSSHFTKLAADSFGHIYVVELDSQYVKKFTTNGNLILTWNVLGSDEEGNSNLSDVATDNNGNVYVVDYSKGTVKKFTGEGQLMAQWGSRSPDEQGEFFSPYSVTVDPSSDQVFIADNDNHRIQVFSSNGTLIRIWGSEGTGQGQFIDPTSIAVDSAGSVYVIDPGAGSRIQKFAHDSVFITNEGDLPPVADAGIDQTASENTAITLNGSKSFDPDKYVIGTGIREKVSFKWRQISGPAIHLAHENTATPTFLTPRTVDKEDTLTFELKVKDYLGVSSVDTVQVVVVPSPRLTTNLSFGDVINLSNDNDGSSGELQLGSSGEHVYAVWTEGPLGRHKIMFRASSDNGLTFTDTIMLRNSTDYLLFNKMYTIDNHVYILWFEYGVTDYAQNRLVFVASDDYGASFSDPVTLANNTLMGQGANMAASDTNVYISWTDYARSGALPEGDYLEPHSAEKLFLLVSRDVGKTFEGPMAVSGDYTGTYDSTQMFAFTDHDQEHLYLAWNSAGSSGEGVSYFVKTDDGGETFSDISSVQGKVEAISVSEGNDSSEAKQPTVSLLLQRIDVISNETYYSAKSNVYYAESKDGGQTFDPQVQLTNQTYGDQMMYSDMSMISSGTIHAKWMQSDSESKYEAILVSTSDDTGKIFNSTVVDNMTKVPIKLSDGSFGFIGDSQSPDKLAIDGNNVYVVYQGSVESDGDIHVFVSRSTDGGHIFEKRIRLDDTAKSFGVSPRLIISADGNVHVAWLGGKLINSDFMGSQRSAETYYISSPQSKTVLEPGSNTIIIIAILAGGASSALVLAKKKIGLRFKKNT